MPYNNYSEWKKKATLGEIYSGDDHSTVVKLENLSGDVEEFEVQLYADGYCHIYYGVDNHGTALYYNNGSWQQHDHIDIAPFPDFVEPLNGDS